MMGAMLLSIAYVIAFCITSGPFTYMTVAPGAMAADHSRSIDASARSSRFGTGQFLVEAVEQLCAAPGSPPEWIVVGRFAVLNPAAVRKVVRSSVLTLTWPVTAIVTPVPSIPLLVNGLTP